MASVKWLVSPPILELRRSDVETQPRGRVMMRDRSKNRKAVQRGRYLSVEAIQAVQALKRSASITGAESKLRRLLKFDMVAVLRELQSQGLALLALQVFEEMRKEHWYKPDLFLYAEMIAVLSAGGFQEDVARVCSYLKKERLEKATSDAHGFNLIFDTLVRSGFSTLATDCFRLMKLWDGKPDEETYRILVCGLEAAGEFDISAPIRQEAEKYLGEPLKCSPIHEKE